ncbi:MAG: hypothetical protein RBQ97_08340 [Acholeplasma sp.]|nr:hypothetical protein [Acholeplasma sp.]
MKNRVKVLKKYFRKLRGVKNEAVETFIQETTEEALLRSKKLLCLVDTKISNPIVISTPNTEGRNDIKFRITKMEDGSYRVDYDHAVLTTLFLSSQGLFYHQAIVNYYSGKVTADLTGEIDLCDISHVQTELTCQDKEDPKYSSLVLKLHIVDGSSILIPLRKHYMYDGYQYPEVLTEKERYIIETIKTAIRLAK